MSAHADALRRDIRARFLKTLWPIPLLLAAIIAQQIRPASLPAPARPALRFHGAPAAVAGLIWVQVAGRIPFLDRVTPREAEMRHRQLALITRLDAENPEPWRYGTLALSLWGRPDLALELGRAGIRRFPEDPDLRMMFHAALALNGPTDTAARIGLLLSAAADQRIPAIVRLRFYRLVAMTAKADGREAQAQAAAAAHDDLAESLGHDLQESSHVHSESAPDL